MSTAITTRTDLKRPLVYAMFNCTDLTTILGKDEDGDECIYEGWRVPAGKNVDFPYITYRISWYPRTPKGFVIGNLLIDVWDSSPGGNDARDTESICTILNDLFDGQILREGDVIVRARLIADEWVEDAEPGRIHRQVVFEVPAIDL